MSTTRLTFLYPHLLRAMQTIPTRTNQTTRWVATTRSKSSFAPRHGKAIEPTWDKPRPDEEQPSAKPSERATPAEDDEIPARQAQSDEEVAKSVETTHVLPKKKSSPELEQPAQPQTATAEAEAEAEAETKTSSTLSSKAADADATDQSQSPEAATRLREPKGKLATRDAMALASPSLDAVLHMPSPDKVEHPQMSPPPYVHHFDSYSMVKQLECGGYTRDQAVSSMKAIRTILAGNLDVAQKSLVSKSDVENETYLFHAACSELGTEIKNNRRLQEEQMRQQRTHLQHEVDILTQTLNQEVHTLNDSVRGLFNDRSMTVREEQKAVESAIQQINYKMSILLSSDSKSSIEGIRWILIRRSVVGLVFLAILTLSMIRYTTYLAQQKKKEAERRRRERERQKRDGGRTDSSAPADAAVILSAS